MPQLYYFRYNYSVDFEESWGGGLSRNIIFAYSIIIFPRCSQFIKEKQ